MTTLKKFLSILTLILFGATAFSQTQSTGPPPKAESSQTDKKEYSDAEIKKLVSVLKKAQKFQGKIRKKMMKVIKESGFTIKEYRKLQQKRRKGESSIPDEKKAQLDSTQQKIKAVRKENQQKMMEILKNEDVTVGQYKSFMKQMRSDKALQKRVKEKMGRGKKQNDPAAPNN